MSLTSRGSVRSGCSGLRRAQRNTKIQCETEHNIYAAYSDGDQQDVDPILNYLKQQNLNIFDPHEDDLPGVPVLKTWLEQGIHRSRVTIIFLTKNFVRHNDCRYQAEHAVMRYTRTKGYHRVLVVMLQSCKIPKYLHHFNCVYAWKFRNEPVAQCDRILRALFAPRTKFRRGSLLCYGVSANAVQLAKKPVHDFKELIQTKKQEYHSLKYLHLLINLSKVKVVLQNCELRCTSENCRFICTGESIFDQFYEHFKVCKYHKVKCQYCRQTILRKNLERHEQDSCKRRRIPCRNESCGQRFTVSESFKHARVCSYKEETCPNKIYGCTGEFARKDKAKHLEICAYEKVLCERCENQYFQIDIDSHSCIVHIPYLNQNVNNRLLSHENDTYKCCFVGCTYAGLRSDVEAHQLTCEYRVVQCADCGIRLPQRDLEWHQRQCDKIIECELCHQLIPSSSKLTHDRWICNRQNIRELCEICHTFVRRGIENNHRASCLVDNHATLTGLSGVPTVLGQVHQLQRQNQSQMSADGCILSGGGGRDKKSVPPESPKKKESPSIEQILLNVVDTPVLDTERSLPQDIDKSSDSFNGWSPRKREKWRYLMNLVDNNSSNLRSVMKASKYKRQCFY